VTGNYVARDPGPNPNISSTPPWRAFLVLGGGFLVVLAIVWFALGAMAGAVAKRVPDAFESRLAALTPLEALQSDRPEDRAARDHLQGIVDAMAATLPARDFEYRVVVVDDDLVNAMAIPGGSILVFRGLLDAVESENELAMVLGHELAHHVHRDPLERLGRSLVVAVALDAILGGNSGLRMVGDLSVEGLGLRMSRDDEREADELGLDLLVGLYGHAGGSTDFFSRLAGNEGDTTVDWLRTHPLSRDRVARIERNAAERGYRFGLVEALPRFDEVPR
jgi:predicted Zn-dependent protease